MKKYIVTVPDDKRSLFDEVVRENQLDIYELNDSDESKNRMKGDNLKYADIPWIEAKKLIDRNAT